MKKFSRCFCLYCTASALFCAEAKAYIYFLPDYNSTDISSEMPVQHHKESACPNLGYDKTSCPAGSFLYNPCPLSSKTHAKYYKKCKTNAAYCTEQGYVSSCPDGQIPDLSDVCPKDGNWYKCKCDPCEGYTYTYAQATAAGYVVDGAGCKSCDEMKYKRKENPCSGYSYDSGNCATTSCGGPGGGSCQSGTKTKYKTCNNQCPPPAIPVQDECYLSGNEFSQSCGSCSNCAFSSVVKGSCPSGYLCSCHASGKANGSLWEAVLCSCLKKHGSDKCSW